MSSYAYLDTPNGNLVCCICRSPFLDPCTTRTCCHTFCYDCIARAIAVSRHCPIDRCPLSIHDLAPADPVVRNLVDELIVECPQRSAGCSYTCQRLLLTAHLKDTCGFVEVACPDDLCDQRMLRKHVSAHTHTQASDRAKDNDAGVIESETLPASGSTLHGANADAPSTSGADDVLATENALLRVRISALEGVVHSLRYEMRAVQRALGPWYRPEDESRNSMEAGIGGHSSPRGTFGGSTPTDPQPPLPSRSSGGTQVLTSPPLSPPHSAASLSAFIPSMPLDPAGLDLTMYFPPAEDASIYAYAVPSDAQSSWQALPPPQSTVHPRSASSSQRIHQPSQSHTSLHAAPSYPFSYPPSYPHPSTFNPAAPYPLSYPGSSPTFTPNALSVPPLDPTTPLPNTLASLHATLGTLAGALGALASAHAAETLRTGEEIRGVRGGMHGLRLQLHDVMTHLTRDASAVPGRMAYSARALPPHAHPGKPPVPVSATKL